MTQRTPDQQSILDDAWAQIVGSMDWLKSVFFGEFADHRPLSAVVADMLVSFIPGVVIVTSARDAVAVILRLANHPEKREELMEWVLLSACLIVIALPLAMAAGGLAAAGVGAIVGGIAGSELGAALRAVMLMLIKEASKLVELVRFLQKFIKGDVLKFLRAVKFAKYEKPLIQALNKISGKLVDIVKSLRAHLESLQYFDTVKAAILKLIEWEKKFYAVQQDALKYVPKALAELDARLAKVLAQTAPKEGHTVASGVQADKTAAAAPAPQRIKDTPGKVLAKVEEDAPKAASTPKSEPKPETPPAPPPKDNPEPPKPPDEGPNSKKQAAQDAQAAANQEKAARIKEQIGSDIKNHPLRQAYEAEVAGLKEEAEAMAKSGATDEEIARKMWARRREIGVKYKNVTPEPLRDYIYEVNTGRYNDPLGPSFESLVKSAEKKMLDPYKTIAESSSRPNGDVNGLLSKFEEWLNTKDSSYLDEALKKIGN
ncbi:hypothetical protein [Pseudoduganella violaceinigra]|uniref:hypothetical protein n=1 Tax=Pseudoduganella violaceinigra TaxID=246602 RepID=UPI00041117C6|nr:hypothetical protein [Pseudoduganella violaceinigra]